MNSVVHNRGSERLLSGFFSVCHVCMEELKNVLGRDCHHCLGGSTVTSSIGFIRQRLGASLDTE